MESDKIENIPRPKLSLKSVIIESQKIRTERGEEFFTNKKNNKPEVVVNEATSKIQLTCENDESEFKKLRESHSKLAHLIVDYDKKIFDKNTQVIIPKKTRSKSLHLYVDKTIENFLSDESKKAETKWGLRKNAGLGQLIQKFILNFIELKKREDRQLKRVKKVIDDFRSNLVEFKKSSVSPDNYLRSEQANQKMKVLSNDLRILLSLLEFEEVDLKITLGNENYDWVEFMLRWKYL